MTISEEQAMNALKSVKYPGFTRDIVSFGLVKSVSIDNGEVKVQLASRQTIPMFQVPLRTMQKKRCMPLRVFEAPRY
jgi:ATP-binding protein involved in chromosome partitioning